MPNLSIHGEAREHEVDVPALRADVAHTIHVELHGGWLCPMTGGGGNRVQGTRAS